MDDVITGAADESWTFAISDPVRRGTSLAIVDNGALARRCRSACATTIRARVWP